MKKRVATVCAFVAVCLCFAFSYSPSHSNELSFNGAPKTAVQLGEMLFFEKMLSADKSISCASCHIPAFGFSDTVAISVGVGGRRGRRNAQPCANMNDRPYLFYDGRAATLEEQVRFPIEDSNEMSLPIAEAVNRLKADRNYSAWFKNVFGTAPSEENLKSAIASFERTLETSDTPFDTYMSDDDTQAMSASAIRGRELFMSSKAKCFDCHFSPDFTGDEFRNIGLYDSVKFKDAGRYEITKNKEDIGKFKVPGLRNVAVTAPYMHNGMFATLREVIDYYDNPYSVVANPINMDTLMTKPLNLSEGEKQDLEQFLIALTDKRFVKKK